MRLPLLSFVVLACSLLRAESVVSQPRPLTLGKPLLRTEPHFTEVANVVPTRSGDLWVADPGGRELARVSGKTGAITVVGREGEGPGEYRAPQMLFPMGVDTLILFDSRLFRLNVYHADGRYLRSVSMGSIETTSNFVSSDDRGRMLGTSIDMATVGTGVQRPVVRFTVASGKLDTIARVVGQRLVALPGHVNKPGMRRYGFVPFADADAVAALTNGGYVIARASSGRVEWHDASGRLTFETMFPGTRQPIADSILKDVEPALRAHIPKAVAVFEALGVVRSTANRVWIRSNQDAGRPSVWYGFMHGERVPLAVQMPRGARIVGASEPYLLVARRTDDGLQQVEVHRLP